MRYMSERSSRQRRGKGEGKDQTGFRRGVLLQETLQDVVSPGGERFAGRASPGAKKCDRRRAVDRHPPRAGPRLAIERIPGAALAGVERLVSVDGDIVAKRLRHADEVLGRLPAARGELRADRRRPLLQRRKKAGAIVRQPQR